MSVVSASRCRSQVRLGLGRHCYKMTNIQKIRQSSRTALPPLRLARWLRRTSSTLPLALERLVICLARLLKFTHPPGAPQPTDLGTVSRHLGHCAAAHWYMPYRYLACPINTMCSQCAAACQLAWITFPTDFLSQVLPGKCCDVQCFAAATWVRCLARLISANLQLTAVGLSPRTPNGLACLRVPQPSHGVRRRQRPSSHPPLCQPSAS